MGSTRLRRSISVAILGALSAILMFLQFPILPAAPYMQLDLSLLVIMLGSILFGARDGALISLIAVLIHMFVRGMNPLYVIGDSIAFVASLAYVLPLYGMLHVNSLKKSWRVVIGIVLATVSLTVVMAMFNGWVMFPIYIQAGGLPQSMNIMALITSVVVPFNLIKGVIIGLSFWLVYWRLEPWMNRQQASVALKSKHTHN